LGNTTIGVRGVSGGILNINRRMWIWDINNASQTYGDIYSTGIDMNYSVFNQGGGLQTYHRFYTCPSTSATANLSLEIGNTATQILNTLNASTSNFSGVLTMLGGVPLTLKDTSNLNYVDMKCVSTGYQVNNPSASGSAIFNFNSVPALTINNTNTRVHNRIDVGTDGGNQTSYFRTAVQMMDMNSPYTNYNQIVTSSQMALYNMNGNMTQHRFATYNAVPSQVVSLDIYSNQIVSRVPLTIMVGTSGPESQISQTGNDLVINNAQAGATTYLKFNNVTSVETSAVQFTTYLPIRLQRPTYTFPFTLATHQGYYLKTTGTAQAVVSGTPKTILTTGSIPIGVWRVDFSVTNTITTGGTITQEQNYVSTTLNGAVTTAVPFTGSVNRAHVNEVYATNDVQVINSSFTYNQSTAGVLYLNIVRSFATGVYSFVGEVSITRLA
jgi:hypothetical protein